jgi:hypothetical protein
MVTAWNGWKLCKSVLASLLLMYIVLLATVQISQRITRRRAEHLLSDLRALQLERSSWSDAQALMQRWGKWGHYKGTCNADSCEYDIQFDSIGMVPGPIVISERFFTLYSRSAQIASSLLGAHLPYVEGGFRVQKNLVLGTWFSVEANVQGESTLFSRVIGTPTRDLEPYDLWPEKDPHPEYRTVLRTGTIGIFFTQFTAATKQEDVEWLTAFNFSCITGWVRCKEMGDLLPSAWAKHLAEGKRVAAIRGRIGNCTYPLEDLVEVSERVAVVQVNKPKSQELQWSPYPVRLVENLKGSGSWHPGDVRQIWSGSDPIAPTEILLFKEDADPVYPHYCGVVSATPENLRTVRAATKGDH